MRLNHFIGNFSIKVGDIKIEDRDFFNQVRNVLKLRIDEKIVLCDGAMNEGTAEIAEYGKNFIRVKVLDVKVNQNEPSKDVVLYCAILKKENFELVVQKATEAGVKEIVPLITERTVKLNVRQDRLEKIIKEAAEQSGRGKVPILHNPVNLAEVIGMAGGNSLNIFFDWSGGSLDDAESLNNDGRIGIWIGPEGGWSEKELKLAGESSFKIINLGSLTLRAETAAIVATYIVVHNLACR